MELSEIGQTSQRIEIKNPNITNLIGLPDELPKLSTLMINGRIYGRKGHPMRKVPMNFSSFKGIPAILPSLTHIRVFDSIIPNLESLTSEMPLLESISFYNCNLHNLKGIPKNQVNISFIDCEIDSIEGLEADNLNILDKSKKFSFLFKTSFSSLHSINRTTLHSILIEYFSRFGDLYGSANLTSKGKELLNECINRDVYDANNPLEFVRRNLPRIRPSDYLEKVIIDSEIKRSGIDFLIYTLVENGFTYPNQNWDEDKSEGEYMMEFWVYALSLEEQLFIPEKIDRLLEFYKKNPTELALQYRSKPNSLSKDQIDRLVHEADHQTLKILENDESSTLHKKDAVITQISQRFAVKTKKGKIFL